MRYVPRHVVQTAPGAAPTRSAWLLHGILGSGQNLRTVARRLAAAAPEWAFILPDLRKHGESHGAPPPHTVAACADDLDALAAHLGVRPVFLSSGGLSGEQDLGDADWSFVGTAGDLGSMLIMDSDVDGDGMDDLAIGAPYANGPWRDRLTTAAAGDKVRAQAACEAVGVRLFSYSGIVPVGDLRDAGATGSASAASAAMTTHNQDVEARCLRAESALLTAAAPATSV